MAFEQQYLLMTLFAQAVASLHVVVKPWSHTKAEQQE